MTANAKGSKARVRRAQILSHIQNKGRASVDELAAIFGATPQTIRKDLSIMEVEGGIMRVHGGAMLLAGNEYTNYEARKEMASEEKNRMGAACSKLIPNNTVIALNAGTTTAAVARNIKYHTGMRVVTDSVLVANDIKSFMDIEVLVPGGEVRRSDGTISGPTAVEFINNFRFDIAIIGAAAIEDSGALLDFNLHEAAVVTAMISHSRHIILVADSSKYGRSAPVQIGHLSEIDTLVTDKRCSRPLRQLALEQSVRLIEA
ncbi:MAG: DeoR/GlpR family DNA-binding transcription regulator [Gammaproteobacteria bacterium]|nr:DeoR/GlpR family DNA-binding transcription regulator [Gammaproteobacteria bacterium]